MWLVQCFVIVRHVLLLKHNNSNNTQTQPSKDVTKHTQKGVKGVNSTMSTDCLFNITLLNKNHFPVINQ